MRLLEVHVVPVWQADGVLRYGMEEEPNHPPVVGWANVLVLDISDRIYELLAVEAEDGRT